MSEPAMINCDSAVPAVRPAAGFAASALLAGACIGTAAMVYVQLGGIMGCVLFAFGLISVVWFNLDLFTGRSQGVWGAAGAGAYGRLGAMLLLNIAGCAAMTLLLEGDNAYAVDPAAIVGRRLQTGALACGIKAIPCGFIMTLSVRAARARSWLPLIAGVPTFIICGFPHCVADVFYYTAALSALQQNIPGAAAVYAATVVGNYLGCNIYRFITKPND